MTVAIAVVFHSRKGHTRALAEAVAEGARRVEGAEVVLASVDDLSPELAELDRFDAIAFGSPTHFGGPSSGFKAFAERTSRAWSARRWKDKLAAGFTVSSGQAGDKLGTLQALALFAMQHGMIWVGLETRPGKSTSRGSDADLNRLGSSLGAMAQANADEGPERAPPASDRATAAALGERLARAALRWKGGGWKGGEPRVLEDELERHPAARHWSFPSPARPRALDRGVERVSLRELCAREGRFEHHLVVVGRIGPAQLEVVTASEPLFFAHDNVSDEYVIALPTGDALVDAFPYRVFLSDGERDLARVKHGVGDLILHPFGLRHWPGRLRPPYAPHAFGPGERRCQLTLVFCASAPCPPAGPPAARPLFVSAGREDDVKAYADPAPPILLADTRRESPRELGAIGDVALSLAAPPFAPARGGYAVVLDAEPSSSFCAADLLYLPPGARLEAPGVRRALLFASPTTEPSPPPPSWDAVPQCLLAPFESLERVPLPIEREGLRLEAIDEHTVRAELGGRRAEVPRYWLARMLFRVALHGFALARVETYGGLSWDDRGGVMRIGIGDVTTEVPRDRALDVVRDLYGAVAPEHYVEDLR